MSEFEEVPLFDMEHPEPLRPQTQRAGVFWTMLKHSRFTCEKCVAFLGTSRADGIKAASFLRQDYDQGERVATSVYCAIHAEAEKRADKASGRWRG